MRRSMLGGPLVLALVLAPPVGVMAQDESAGSTVAARPLHIHVGACPLPGEIVGPMSDVVPIEGDHVGAPGAIAVESTRSTVDMPLSSLLDSEHAILVHRSYPEFADLIACGDIGGSMIAPGPLIMGIGPVGDSGYAGIAVLTDRGDGTTMVEVVLTHFGAAQPQSSAHPHPSAQPYPY